jgi:hypothetical protein
MTVAIRREHGQIAIRIINLSPNGGRKLDFVPEEAAVSSQHPAFSQQASRSTGSHRVPEFSFDTP